MKFTTIRIEGPILSGDILEKIEQGEIAGQSARDFGLNPQHKVKDEIAAAWADVNALWGIFKRQRERIAEDDTGTAETRRHWMLPLLGILGYDIQLTGKANIVNGKSYAISHQAVNLDEFPLHIMGCNDSLDKKRSDSGPRMSPHALLQEYINLTEHLYGIVTNGLCLRILRDSSRLIRLSYIEFDLEAMLEEQHFADFAVFYRLLHSSRMPSNRETASECFVEGYHQDALESGSRIRSGLSTAVERSIRSLANGFLNHPNNSELTEKISSDQMSAGELYQELLRLIYRVLFLMVIEERKLVFPPDYDPEKRAIYFEYYSIQRLRKICEKPYLADQRYHDLWIALKHTFSLFESGKKGEPFGLKSLGGDLFERITLHTLLNSNLDNKTLLECLKNLSIFKHEASGQYIRVNYGSLNVEEFGSVYEGLLEFQPVIRKTDDKLVFEFEAGTDRSATGSHYTPDELVQPLIRHSLDYLIKDCLKKTNPEAELLSLKVCDVACGSGHILLSAARRIGTELAKLRTGEDQPSPSSFRQGVRDVIKKCIYGVDKNPLAVDLCKVALWLEAHVPGEPLNMLEHRIKCGDAIVGLAHRDELFRGIPNEAFKKLENDDGTIVKELKKRNQKERKDAKIAENFLVSVQGALDHLTNSFKSIDAMPESTPDEVQTKQKAYQKLTKQMGWDRLKTIADIQVAQFFIPKTMENVKRLTTDGEYRQYLDGTRPLQTQAVAMASAVARENRFFHWFLEFPKVFEQGGFDCILGNPPYLGEHKLSGTFGYRFVEWTKYIFQPAKGCDLVTFFIRRNYSQIKKDGFCAIITTNSIIDGRTREGGLGIIEESGGSINFALRSIIWPGIANLYVSLVSIFKGDFIKDRFLDSKKAKYISSFFEEYSNIGKPYKLEVNQRVMFQGSKILGDGYILSESDVKEILTSDPRNKEVVFPLINGKDLNSKFDQSFSRYVINFFNWELSKAQSYSIPYEIIKTKVKPIRDLVNRKSNRENWWIYAENRPGLYSSISGLEHCFITTSTTKYLLFSLSKTNLVFTHALFVYATDKFCDFSIVQSTIHEEWARKYSGSLKLDLRYSPSNCFVTFPFPQDLVEDQELELETGGRDYHDFRKALMLKLKLGLTKTYNLFHYKNLTVETVEKASGQSPELAQGAYQDILTLRGKHKEMDNLVLAAYGWPDVDLAHDFYEVEYLPENDRVRYTISPDSRKEILQRLLKLNHEIHAKEKKDGKTTKTKKNSKKQKYSNGQISF